MPNDFYAKGTIKVRNQDNATVPFMPNTDTESVVDDSGNTLKTVISNLEQRTAAAAQKGGIKVMYDEPTAQNTSSFAAKTLIGQVLSEGWTFTVDTEASISGNRKTGIPFTMQRPYRFTGVTNITLYVDWGDGSTTKLSQMVSGYDMSNSVHEYESPGQYTITIRSEDWSNVYIFTQDEYWVGLDINDNHPLTWFSKTLVEVNTPLPAIKGREYFLRSGVYSTTDNSLSYLFWDCECLRCVHEDVFKNNPEVTSFTETFRGCRSLQSLPERLFASNTKAAYFSSCFNGCDSLRSLPPKLFANNALAQYFTRCFIYCDNLESLPVELFRYNTEAVSFMYCFHGCPKLKNFKLIIGSSKVTNDVGYSSGQYDSSFINDATDVERIICVPPNTTTYTKFNALAGNSKKCVTLSSLNVDCLETLEFTVNTEATEEGAVDAAVPLRLASRRANTKLTIDWGDGTANEYMPDQVSAECFTHSYASPGTYQISVGLIDTKEYEFLIDQQEASSNALLQTFRNTVVSVEESLPNFANLEMNWLFNGCAHLQSVTNRLFGKMPKGMGAVACFKGCASLQEIPAGLLKDQTELLDATSMFEGCSSLAYIPSGLLSQCKKLASANKMFKGCASLESCPDTLLLNNASLASVKNMFSGCSDENPSFLSKSQLEDAGFYVELFDTEASEDGGSTIGIPYNLYNRSVSLTVDWGDGNAPSVLSASSYSSATNSTPSIHQYSNAGLYFVKMRSSDWSSTVPMSSRYANNIYDLGTSGSGGPAQVAWRRFTLLEVATRLPNQFGSLTCYAADSYPYGMETKQNSVAYFYAACKHLRKIPSDLFAGNPSLADFSGCFCYCYALESIPESLFASNPAATNFNDCFNYCTGISSIPASLFANNASVESFARLFYYCQGISSIPDSLFANASLASNFQYCFGACKNLESIPAGLFTNNAAATNFSNCFYFCPKVESIPASLFSSCTEATTFEGCFYDCVAISSIPAGLFSNCTAAENFERCFCQCDALSSIPENLFANNALATNFNDCFYHCDKISSIPARLFANNPKAANFGSCFGALHNLTSIPAGLFANCPEAKQFSGCFRYCSKLASIPENLFASCTDAVNFNNCFAECTSLASIPADLFKYNVAATIFSSCFYKCSALQSIPADLFKYNVAADTFRECFESCSVLATIPSDLFKYAIAATNFYMCFYSCSALGGFETHIGSPDVSDASYFASTKSGTTRTVYVPANSTTYATFVDVSSYLGLTIVEE